MVTESINETQHACAWILKSLYTNKQWFDEIRHAGYDSFERKYHYIPLYDLAQISTKHDIKTLMEACYQLKEYSHIDIWGDDFEPYGMLVQISSEGVTAMKDNFYESDDKSQVSRRAIGVFATLTVIAALVIGINKSFVRKQDKAAPSEYNKVKSAEIPAKSTAFVRAGE